MALALTQYNRAPRRCWASCCYQLYQLVLVACILLALFCMIFFLEAQECSPSLATLCSAAKALANVILAGTLPASRSSTLISSYPRKAQSTFVLFQRILKNLEPSTGEGTPNPNPIANTLSQSLPSQSFITI